VAIIFDAADELVEAHFARVNLQPCNNIRDTASGPHEFV
jgi:hypothetical protein